MREQARVDLLQDHRHVERLIGHAVAVAADVEEGQQPEDDRAADVPGRTRHANHVSTARADPARGRRAPARDVAGAGTGAGDRGRGRGLRPAVAAGAGVRQSASVRLREINVGCFGGGTGLPSLLGGLKQNPWLRVNAVVTMFDNGGSSGQLRDQLGVLPPGDVLRCALALARNETEARRLLLSRLPALENGRLGGHTGGNLLLSIMEQYSGDFLAAVDGLSTLLDCNGRVWPVSVEHAAVCAEHDDGSRSHGEVEVDRQQREGRSVRTGVPRPRAADPCVGERRHPDVRRLHHRPRQLLHQPDADPAGRRRRRRGARHRPAPSSSSPTSSPRAAACTSSRSGPPSRRVGDAIGRPVDVVIANTAEPGREVLDRYAAEHKELLRIGDVPGECELVTGGFWQGSIARHARRRLAYAVWSVLAERLL